MKIFKKILSLALVLTMLATCAVSGLVTASAATPNEVVISDNPSNRGVFCTNWGSQNLRFTGGTFNGIYLGAFDAAYSSADDVIYTFDNGKFSNVNICSRWSQLNLSGNVYYNVNGGSFSYEHDYQFDIDNDGIDNGVTQPEHAIMMGDVGGVRKTNTDSWQGNRANLNDPNKGEAGVTVRINNLAVIINRGNQDLVLNAVAQHTRPPHKDGVWMVIVNNCTDATAPTLTGNAGNNTDLVHGTDTEHYINTAAFLQGDYRMYVKGGEAYPVYDGTNLLGFTLTPNTAGLVPKITYNYYDASRGTNRKAVVYPTKNENGVYDLSKYSYNKDNAYGYAHIVEFVPVVEALGASLRYVNDDANFNGIRFGVKFSQNFVTGAGDETANFGVILMAKSNYVDHEGEWTLEELKASEKARIATGRYCIEDPAAQTYTVNAVLYNIPEANYESEIIAIPYIGDTLYTAATRSMYQVALACVNDENAPQEAKDYCQTILDSVHPTSAN